MKSFSDIKIENELDAEFESNGIFDRLRSTAVPPKPQMSLMISTAGTYNYASVRVGQQDWLENVVVKSS